MKTKRAAIEAKLIRIEKRIQELIDIRKNKNVHTGRMIYKEWHNNYEFIKDIEKIKQQIKYEEEKLRIISQNPSMNMQH